MQDLQEGTNQMNEDMEEVIERKVQERLEEQKKQIQEEVGKKIRKEQGKETKRTGKDTEQKVSRRQFLKMLGVGAGTLALTGTGLGVSWSKVTPSNQGTSDIKSKTALKGVTNGSAFKIEDTANNNDLLSVAEGGAVTVKNTSLDVAEDIQTTGGTVIWDSGNGELNSAVLPNTSINKTKSYFYGGLG